MTALAVSLVLSVPAVAQGTEGPLAGSKVVVRDGNDSLINTGDLLVVVANGDYKVSPTASVTVKDNGGTPGDDTDDTEATFNNDENARIRSVDGEVQIRVTSDFAADQTPTTQGVTVVSSSGIQKTNQQPPPDADGDGDGVNDDQDNCPNDANPQQEDADGDGTGDACEENPGDDPLPQDDEKGPLAGGVAFGKDVLVPEDQDCGPNGEFFCIDQVVIATENCEITGEGEKLTITLNDQGVPFRLIDGDNVDITILKDGTIQANGRKVLGPIATRFNRGDSQNKNQAILQIPVDPENDDFSDAPNDRFPIVSSTGIGGKGCQAVESARDDSPPDDTTPDDSTPDDSTPTGPTDDPVPNDDGVIDDTVPEQNLPNTGGPALLPIAALLMASGMMCYAIIRRRP